MLDSIYHIILKIPLFRIFTCLLRNVITQRY